MHAEEFKTIHDLCNSLANYSEKSNKVNDQNIGKICDLR